MPIAFDEIRIIIRIDQASASVRKNCIQFTTILTVWPLCLYRWQTSARSANVEKRWKDALDSFILGADGTVAKPNGVG